MRKEIIKTLEIGKAVIEITMVCSSRMSDLDGYRFETKDIEKSVSATLTVEGKLIESSTEGFIYPSDDVKGRFGNKYIKASTVAAILEAIKEMYADVEEEFAVKTTPEIETEKEVVAAEKIIAELKIRKAEILSDVEERIWVANYNSINNEGREGYTPTRATIEDVLKAKKVLGIK